jgi:predicted small lipoprotein YifL
MKNLFKLFVMLFAVVAFAACNNTTEAPAEEAPVEEVAPEAAPVEEAPVETPADTTAAPVQ